MFTGQNWRHQTQKYGGNDTSVQNPIYKRGSAVERTIVFVCVCASCFPRLKRGWNLIEQRRRKSNWMSDAPSFAIYSRQEIENCSRKRVKPNRDQLSIDEGRARTTSRSDHLPSNRDRTSAIGSRCPETNTAAILFFPPPGARLIFIRARVVNEANTRWLRTFTQREDRRPIDRSNRAEVDREKERKRERERKSPVVNTRTKSMCQLWHGCAPVQRGIWPLTIRKHKFGSASSAMGSFTAYSKDCVWNEIVLQQDDKKIRELSLIFPSKK